MATQLPTADEVSNALSALLRREVRAKAAKIAPSAALTIGGLYHDGNGKLLGSVTADLGFAAYSGACFSLIPADSAEESIGAGALDESMQENFAEVLNVASRLFTVSGGGRVALKIPFFPPAPLPAEATAGTGTHFDINIDGYGYGILCLRALG